MGCQELERADLIFDAFYHPFTGLRLCRMNTHSLKKRFFYKLSSNTVSLTVGFILASIVPRSLGVEQYGQYSFLVSIITQILLFVELRTSYCFFTKLSQRPLDKLLPVFYGYCIFTIFVLFTCVVLISSFTNIKRVIFLDQIAKYILLASGVVFLNWINSLFSQMMDAYGKTIWMEKVQVSSKLLSCSMLMLLACTHYLDLNTYFLFQYGSQILLAISYISHLRRNHDFSIFMIMPREQFLKYLFEFYEYCTPLFYYLLIGLSSQFCDRWILQYYGGSYQQGLYAFCFALSNVSAMLTNAMLPLLQREISMYALNSNIEAMGALFKCLMPLIYGFTAFLCAFVFVQADILVLLLGGDKYVDATVMFRIGSLYPLIYAYGNLHSTLFYSTNRNKTYFMLAIITTPFSILIAYILMSHSNAFGQNMGGKGLIVKELAMGVLNCIVYLLVNTKYLSISRWNFMVHLFAAPMSFMMLGYISIAFTKVFVNTTNYLPFLFLSSFLYSILSILYIWALPSVLALDRESLYKHMHNAARFLTNHCPR